MTNNVEPVVFRCADHNLAGMLHTTTGNAHRGVLIVVGGPQYRVGSHRQFVHLARDLATGGYPVFRFDYRGMGDSDGDTRTFEAVEDDIHAAVDEFLQRCPNLDDVVLWGLCDAATASAFYAAGDPRIAGLILVNPWVRTDQGIARSYLRNYYSQRLLQPAFWKQLLTGQIKIGKTFGSFLRDVAAGIGTGKQAKEPPAGTEASSDLPERMAQSVARFAKPILFVISGQDLTAGEFEATAKSRSWKQLLRRRKDVTWLRLDEADHTFSQQVWRNEVASRCIDWLRTL